MNGFAVAPLLADVYGALVAFIGTVTGLPASQIILGLGDRTSMPLPGFIVVQAIDRKRLRTNIHGPVNIGVNQLNIEEGVELAVQIDCYSYPVAAGQTTAEDWATMLSSTLRDEYGCTQLAPTMQPLYADEARMIPLVAGEEQYEERWSLDAHFQYNPNTTIPQQSAAALKLRLEDVPSQAPYG